MDDIQTYQKHEETWRGLCQKIVKLKLKMQKSEKKNENMWNILRKWNNEK